ncbi:hypothetical protein [Alteromonas antoniana]|uniref:hypothetical protein n=1 Tax=Alteromonas antoniana TaxID=2803813 RepID=UPI001C48FCE5|nr:hypothetical protein [Alteromonas antoniana]
MNPFEFLLLLLPVWALTHFWLLPLMKNRWEAGNIRQKIARSGSLILIEKVRDLTVVAVITVFCVMIFIWLNNLLASGDLIVAGGVISSFDSLLKPLDSIKKDYESALIMYGLLGAALCLYFINKQAKKKLTNAWIEKAIEVRERFTQNPAGMDKFESHSELKPVVERVREILGYLSIENVEDSEVKLTQEQSGALHDELDQLLMMLALEQAKAEIDLNDVLSKPLKSEQSQPKTPLKRIMRILTSNQFAKDLGLLNRPLSYVATGLLIVSLMGWASAPLANSLKLSVNNLRMNAASSDVSRQFDKAISRIDEVTPDVPDVAEAVDDVSDSADSASQLAQVSRILAREAINQMVHSKSISGAGPRASRAEFVRAAILEQTFTDSRQANQAHAVRADVAKQVATAGGTEKEVAELVGQLEREIKSDLEKVKKRNPSYFKSFVRTVEARYATSINAFDAQSNLISRVVSQAFSPIDIDSANEITKQGGKILKDVGGESVKTWANSYAKAVVIDALFEQSHASVVEKLNSKFRFHTSQQTQQLFANLSSAENHGWKAAPADANSRLVSQNLANNVSDRYSDPAVKTVVKQSLGGYAELFPDAIAASAEAATRASSGRYSTGSARTGTHVASRSTNFKMASRSFRVRGVLFGQDLTGDNLNITDIRWEFHPQVEGTPTQVSISLKLNGKWQSIGNFPAGIVNQAIRYAADQRVVATTITPGDDELISRITYLHPVLEDTPLGCRVVEADRFVDTFTATDEESTEPVLNEIAQNRMALGQFLAFTGLAEGVGYANRSGYCPAEELSQLIQQHGFGEIVFPPTLLSSLTELVESEFTAPVNSRKLLDASIKCSQVARKDSAACLCDSLSSGLLLNYWFPEDHTSQFREKPASLSEDLTWLEQSEDRFEHIDLWLHTTFALRKLTFEGEGVPDESTATPLDFNLDQLTAMKQVIVSKLLHPYLSDYLNSPSADEFMAPLEQFVVLQRLMRAALNGQLGSNFPLEKLIALSRQTQSYVPYQPTIRWEPYQNSEEELMEVLAATDESALKHYNEFNTDRMFRYALGRPTCGVVSL